MIELTTMNELNNRFVELFLLGDDQPLLSSMPNLGNGETNVNTPSTLDDLNETSLKAAIIQIANWTDESR